VLDEVVVIRFNDVEGTRQLLSAYARDLAAIVIDPMPSRGGLIAPKPEFIRAVQSACKFWPPIPGLGGAILGSYALLMKTVDS
jgi:glutamate-1-semialdehyde aminotransferase